MRRTVGRRAHRQSLDGRAATNSSDRAQALTSMRQPPEDTRAYFRGRCIARYPDAIAAASWDSMIFDTGKEALQRIPMREPLRGTREHVAGLLDRAPDAASLVDLLQS